MALSWAVAGGGILACAAAMLDLLAPTASIAAFIAVMVGIGVAVAGVVATFAWLCDCWDKPLPPARPAEHVNIRSEQLMDLTIWLPAMFSGLAAFGLMFACIPACDKV